MKLYSITNGIYKEHYSTTIYLIEVNGILIMETS